MVERNQPPIDPLYSLTNCRQCLPAMLSDFGLKSSFHFPTLCSPFPSRTSTRRPCWMENSNTHEFSLHSVHPIRNDPQTRQVTPTSDDSPPPTLFQRFPSRSGFSDVQLATLCSVCSKLRGQSGPVSIPERPIYSLFFSRLPAKAAGVLSQLLFCPRSTHRLSALVLFPPYFFGVLLLQIYFGQYACPSKGKGFPALTGRDLA